MAILFVFLCSPSKKASQNLGGFHFLSAEQSQGYLGFRHPQKWLKQPHYFKQRKLPKCGTVGTTHLDPKTKAGIRETLVHLETAASLQAHEASQTSMFPRDSIHPYIVILHPNWQQSCTASCQRVTNCRMEPHLSAGAARPPPQIPLWTLYEQIKAMPSPSNMADFIILTQA